MPDTQQRAQEAPERELPMLAGIAEFLHWCEELLNIVNGPVLLAGMFIALIDLLTDGKLTATEPILLYVWAGSQALGIDGQLMGSWARVSHARGWRLLGWLIVGVVLGVAAWQAGYVFAVQQTEGISEAAALAQLQMPAETWLGWRMFLAVGLIALHAITRYRRPAKAKISLEDERADLERELTLEPLRQALRARQVGGLRTLAEAALRGADAAPALPSALLAPAPLEATDGHPTATLAGQEAPAPTSPDPSILPDDRPPTGGGSPLASKPRRGPGSGLGGGNITPIARRGLGRAPRRDKKTAARANALSGARGTAEARIRAALAAAPGLSHDELVKVANVSSSTASKWLTVIQTERAAEQAAQ